MVPPPDNSSDAGRVRRTIEDGTISEVIRTVAVRADRRPEELPSLNEVVDPDCLDEIFQPKPDGTPRHGGEVVFPYAGYQVRIIGHREIEVRQLPDRG